MIGASILFEQTQLPALVLPFSILSCSNSSGFGIALYGP